MQKQLVSEAFSRHKLLIWEKSNQYRRSWKSEEKRVDCVFGPNCKETGWGSDGLDHTPVCPPKHGVQHSDVRAPAWPRASSHVSSPGGSPRAPSGTTLTHLEVGLGEAAGDGNHGRGQGAGDADGGQKLRDVGCEAERDRAVGIQVPGGVVYVKAEVGHVQLARGLKVGGRHSGAEAAGAD